MIPSKAQIKALEEPLDYCLSRRPIFGFDANETLLLVANAAETASVHNLDGAMHSTLSHGIDAYAAHLVSGRQGPAPDIEQVIADLVFGAHYQSLRELLYYSYNAPGTIDWTLADGRIELRYVDRSLPRQFFTTLNEWVMGSLAHFHDNSVSEQITSMLKGLPEWELTDAHKAIAPLLEAEANHKLAAYFSILNRDAEIDLGGYSYRQFTAVYRLLLIKALYHRHHAVANNTAGCVFIDPAALVSDIAQESTLEAATIEAILCDLVYDGNAVRQRVDATYFALHRQGRSTGHILMQPTGFSMAEGLVQLLRVVAKRRPRAFLTNVSNMLGSAFVARAAKTFEAQGFICRTDVSLRRIDPGLPDIDLLVISEEPTLGFVLLVCEVKSPLPPLWAKDRLRALEPTNISKAFRQAEAIRSFLSMPDGVNFVRSLVPKDGIEHFDSFVVIVKQLIITSDNGGMFFDQEEMPVMNFRTMERLLARCDGDISYLLHFFRGYKEAADAYYETPMATLDLDGLEIAYEQVQVRSPFDFPQHMWRSDGTRERVIADFVTDGHHPFDSLQGKVAVKVPGVDAFLLRDTEGNAQE